MSTHNKVQKKEHVTVALHRAKFKFPGCQKIHISKMWGFTKFKIDEFEDTVTEKQLIPDSCVVKYIVIMAPGQTAGSALRRALALSPPCSCPPINPTFLSKNHKNHNNDN